MLVPCQLVNLEEISRNYIYDFDNNPPLTPTIRLIQHTVTSYHVGGTEASVDVAATKLTFYVTAAASESEYDGNRSSWPGPLPTM